MNKLPRWLNCDFNRLCRKRVELYINSNWGAINLFNQHWHCHNLNFPLHLLISSPCVLVRLSNEQKSTHRNNAKIPFLTRCGFVLFWDSVLYNVSSFVGKEREQSMVMVWLSQNNILPFCKTVLFCFNLLTRNHFHSGSEWIKKHFKELEQSQRAAIPAVFRLF